MIRYLILVLVVCVGCDRASESTASSKGNEAGQAGAKLSKSPVALSEGSIGVLEAKRAFEDYMLLRGMNLKGLVPDQAMEAMIGFYSQRRIKRCAIANDGDTLLCQWGTVNLGEGENFEFDLIRKMIVGANKEDGMYQLSLTLYYIPTKALRDIKCGNIWCESPDKVSEYRDLIRTSEAYQKASTSSPKDVILALEKV